MNIDARSHRSLGNLKSFRIFLRASGHFSVQARLRTSLLIFLALLFGSPLRARAYSVLTHDAIIDTTWHSSIRPLLLVRFPTATPAQLAEARSYAYGGATIQDLGYYPFGHQFFSNLTHYVRTGDFVDNLLQDSQTVDEYAFALGALSHYVGDNNGHRFATNPSTAIEFPRLEKKYGPIVTYEQAPHAHIRTEFAYDIEQLSHQRFAPPGYLRSVGFKVPRNLLERAFTETYGLPLRAVLGRPEPAIRSYRSSVGKFLPTVAQAEVLIHRNEFPREEDTPAFHQFIARQNRAEQENGWAGFSRKPGFKVRFYAVVIRILPKLGPLSGLSIRGPNMETNRWYIESVNRSMDRYEALLDRLKKNPRRSLHLPDCDLDTGNVIRPGGYRLTDTTYAELVSKLTKQPLRPIPAQLRRNILRYYSDPSAPIATRKNPAAWKRLQAQLVILRGMQTLG